ncbi:DUF4173 domain-containing protein [Paenibacillus sp. JX-17]|uniref:DUF4173 domain-containing protein n=1 Tax=Paenibacillus lacisoli TaxID=3064525 RepID=A0ABT9CCG8_9BACL|nr:DUF4173 domain-containing protein [Paenibacillus sp. JX-17]MDO7906963.1 DUF4173 domain-containing protein [Paenibacillus sp. JX-17]
MGRQPQAGRYTVLRKIAAGLVIAIPFLAIVITLLVSADGNFGRVLSLIPRHLTGLSFGSVLARLLWILIAGLCLAAFLWGLLQPKRFTFAEELWNEGRTSPPTGENVKAEGKDYSQRSDFAIDPVIMLTLLVMVNAVYILFVVIQFSYFFGAWEGLLPKDMTYAAYARKGFFELILVSSLNFTLLLITLRYALDHARLVLQRLNQFMLFILAGCSGVMLFSAYMKLAMYEEAYGYTYTRIHVSWCMPL